MNLGCNRRAVLMAALLTIGVASHAATFPLFSTGVDAAGQKLGGGATDPHWTIVAGPRIKQPKPAVVMGTSVDYGYAQSDTAEWIWVNADGLGGLRPYTFEVRFNVPADKVKRARLNGRWALDDVGVIRLNGGKAAGTGTDLSTPADTNYLVLHDFSVGRGFVAGENVLQFVVHDTGTPGGLVVDALTLSY